MRGRRRWWGRVERKEIERNRLQGRDKQENFRNNSQLGTTLSQTNTHTLDTQQ